MKSFIGLSLIAFSNGVFSQSVTTQEWEQLRLLNILRKDGYTCPDGTVFPANPTALEWNCGLWKAGQLHSQDMANKSYFSHTGATGTSPWDRADDQGVSANAENIAAGRSDAANTLEQWKGSNGHCLNMMNKNHQSVGVGYGYNTDAPYDHYWTQMLSYSTVSKTQKSCYQTPTQKPTPEPTPPPVPTVTPTAIPTSAGGSMMHAEELEFFRLVNNARVNGIPDCHGEMMPPAAHPFEWNCGLWRAAHGHSVDMATNNFFSRTGTDGSSHSDRAKREGADGFGCEGFMLGGSSNAVSAYKRFEQLTCSYYMMEAKYMSFGVGVGYTPESGYKWTIMLGKSLPTDALKTCYDDVASPTPDPTLAPTIAPTEGSVAACKDFTKKKTCKKNDQCIWKKKCKTKASVCKGSKLQKKEKKCKKFGCNWDGACSWSA